MNVQAISIFFALNHQSLSKLYGHRINLKRPQISIQGENKLCIIKLVIWSKTYLDQILSLNNRVLFRRLLFDKIRKSIVLLQSVLFLDSFLPLIPSFICWYNSDVLLRQFSISTCQITRSTYELSRTEFYSKKTLRIVRTCWGQPTWLWKRRWNWFSSRFSAIGIWPGHIAWHIMIGLIQAS